MANLIITGIALIAFYIYIKFINTHQKRYDVICDTHGALGINYKYLNMAQELRYHHMYFKYNGCKVRIKTVYFTRI